MKSLKCSASAALLAKEKVAKVHHQRLTKAVPRHLTLPRLPLSAAVTSLAPVVPPAAMVAMMTTAEANHGNQQTATARPTARRTMRRRKQRKRMRSQIGDHLHVRLPMTLVHLHGGSFRQRMCLRRKEPWIQRLCRRLRRCRLLRGFQWHQPKVDNLQPIPHQLISHVRTLATGARRHSRRTAAGITHHVSCPRATKVFTVVGGTRQVNMMKPGPKQPWRRQAEASIDQMQRRATARGPAVLRHRTGLQLHRPRNMQVQVGHPRHLS